MKIFFMSLGLSLSLMASAADKKECAQEGMRAGGSTVNALSCCQGLTQTNWWQHENLKNGCNVPPPPGTDGSCVKCGDKKCDSKNFENKCNCPQDCP